MREPSEADTALGRADGESLEGQNELQESSLTLTESSVSPDPSGSRRTAYLNVLRVLGPLASVLALAIALPPYLTNPVKKSTAHLDEAWELMGGQIGLGPIIPTTEKRVLRIAKQRIEDAINLTPRSFRAYRYLGLCLMFLDEDLLAEEALRRAIFFNEEDSESYRLLGEVYAKLGRKQMARGAFQRAARLGGDAIYFGRLGSYQIDMGDCGAAIDSYRRAVGYEPEAEIHRRNLLRGLFHCEKYFMFLGGLEEFPDHLKDPQIFLLYVHSFRKINAPLLAVEACLKYVPPDEGSGEVVGECVELFWRQEKRDRAIDLLEGHWGESRGSSQFALKAARLLLDRGLLVAAEEYLHKIPERFERYYEAQALLMEVHKRRRRSGASSG